MSFINSRYQRGQTRVLIIVIIFPNLIVCAILSTRSVFVFVYLAPFPNIPPGPRVSAQCLRGSFYIVMLPRFNIVCVSDIVCVCICRVPPFCPTGFQHCWQSLVLTGQVFPASWNLCFFLLLFVFSSPLCWNSWAWRGWVFTWLVLTGWGIPGCQPPQTDSTFLPPISSSPSHLSPFFLIKSQLAASIIFGRKMNWFTAETWD